MYEIYIIDESFCIFAKSKYLYNVPLGKNQFFSSTEISFMVNSGRKTEIIVRTHVYVLINNIYSGYPSLKLF